MEWKEWPVWVQNIVLLGFTLLVLFTFWYTSTSLMAFNFFSVKGWRALDLREFIQMLLPLMSFIPPLIFLWIMKNSKGLIYGSLISLGYNVFDIVILKTMTDYLPDDGYVWILNAYSGLITGVLLTIGIFGWLVGRIKARNRAEPSVS